MGKLQDKMQMVMEVKGLSPKTQKTYLACVRRFVAHYERAPETLGTEEIRTFLHYLIKDRQGSSSSINQHYSALKFLYETTLGLEWETAQIPRTKRPKKLPVILSMEEVRQVLACVHTLKHRSVLTTIYSGGLRLQEALDLRVADIDSERMLIRVRQGKGQKERYTLLSHVALQLLRQYWSYERPTDWLFPGRPADRPLSPSSIQRVMQRAVKESDISKPAHVHTLRHCFATHLLESGVDLYHIQKMMGHGHASTTAIYLHVTHRGLAEIVSPMDQWETLEQPTF
jgi:site-specific recombinase XerD